MRAAEDIEGLLEIAVIGERPAVAGQQRLVAGMGKGGLFEHGDGLAPLPGGTQGLTGTDLEPGPGRRATRRAMTKMS